MCWLAGEFAALHGILAVDIARRAYRCHDVEGDELGAEFWFAMSILVDDVMRHRLDAEHRLSIH
jgi:hypothetical protein